MGTRVSGYAHWRWSLCMIAPSILLAVSSDAYAGDMDAVGIVIIVVYGAIGAILVGSVAALWACKYIVNVRLRTLVRLLIVVSMYTPIPHYDAERGATSVAPAFLSALQSSLFSVFAGSGNHSPAHAGPFSHPFALAYGVVLLLSIPLLMLWVHIGEGYRDRASHSQRARVASSPAANAAPTNPSQ
jgi:hypothetical protein